VNRRHRICQAAAALAVGLWLAAATEAHASDAARQQLAALAGGGDFSVMADRDGSVWAWGSNAYGQLGTGDDTAHPSPIQVTAADGRPLGDAVAVAAGTHHALAVRTDGTVWTWGDRQGGSRASAVSFGDGTPLSGVIAASAGGSHNLALLADGTVRSWGDNSYGQLGDGTTMDRPAPVQVMLQDQQALTNVTAIAAGSDYSLALRSDGTVWTWGRLNEEQAGDGPIRSRKMAEPVLTATGAALSDAIQLAAGAHTAYALRSDGTIWAWEADTSGSAPHPVRGADDAVLTGNRAISAEADSDRLLALGDDGLVREWQEGAVAIVPVRGPSYKLYDIRTLAAGRDHGLALAADGTLWTWGSNIGGQLGRGDIGGDSGGYAAPVLTYLQRRYTTAAIGAAGSASMELAGDGSFWAYGNNLAGQLGSGPDNSPTSLPRQVVLKDNQGALANIVQWSMGASHAVAVDASGQVWAWGANHSKELGADMENNADYSNEAVKVELPLAVKSVAAGGSHTAALTRDGRVLVWGDNAYGQIGSSSLAAQSGPAFVLTRKQQMLSDVVAVSSGDSYTLALTADGRVWSWGRNNYGQLGNGIDEGERTFADPVLTLDGDLETPLSGIAAIAAGPEHALALAADGRIYAWGSNSDGQLGLGDGISRSYAVPLSSAKKFVAVSAGYRASAAIDTEGNIWTWGSNADDILGNGEQPGSPPILEPARITDTGGFTAVSLGGDHGLALTGGGAVYVWGSNQYGQLGHINRQFVQSPVLRQSPQPLAASPGRVELSVLSGSQTPDADGNVILTVRLDLKDDSGQPLWEQRPTVKTSSGIIGPLQELFEGGYFATWKLPAASISIPATVQVYLRNEKIKEITYPSQP
jgi:alpha-tubulin suppressor-like RCC1 family protein